MTSPIASATESSRQSWSRTSDLIDRLWRRGFREGTPRLLSLVTTAAILAGAGLIIATAAIHLHLWLQGYRHVPRIGVLFLLQSIVGFLMAPFLAFGRHTATIFAGAGYMAASATGLLLSANGGFLGIHDGLNVPWAMTSLTVELVGLVLLGSAGVLRLLRG